MNERVLRKGTELAGVTTTFCTAAPNICGPQ